MWLRRSHLETIDWNMASTHAAIAQRRETMITLPPPTVPSNSSTTLSAADPSPAPTSAPASSTRDARTAERVVIGLVVAASIVATFLFGTPAAVAAALVIGAAAAVVDVGTRRLPNRLVALSAVAAGLGVATARGPDTTAVAVAACIGALCFAGPLFVTHLGAPGAVGFGDVKLAAALGLALGLVDPRLGLLALCVACGTTAAAGLITSRRALPLGPGLVVGALIAVTLGGKLWA
jgi:leader peptidase (prepilin peptidase) / N-methyltransferase